MARRHPAQPRGFTGQDTPLPLLPTAPELAAQFDTIGPLLQAVLAVRMHGHMLKEHSPFRQVTTDTLAPLNDRQRRAVIAYLFDVALRQPKNRVFLSNSENSGTWILSNLGRRKLGWTVEELAWLARFVRLRHLELDEIGLSKTLALLTASVERAAGDLAPLADDLIWLQAWMVRIVRQDSAASHQSWWRVDPTIEKYAARLHAVIGQAMPATLPDHVLDDRDGFGLRARAATFAVVSESTVADLVLLLQGYGSAPRPSLRWRTQAANALRERPDLLVAARALVHAAKTQPDPVVPEGIWVEHWVHPDSQALIRAAVWAVALVDPSDKFTSELRDLGAHVAGSPIVRG